MHPDHDALLQIEDALGASDADAYRRHLADDAVVVVPGAVLDRDGCIAAIEASDPWDEREITDARSVAIGDDAALVTYRWRSRRGDTTYLATLTSLHVLRDGTWRLTLHQQTPDPG